MVTVANCLNLDENTRLKYQTLHELAWSEIIDVLGQSNFSRVLPNALKVFCCDAGRYTAANGDIAAAAKAEGRGTSQNVVPG